ncbi:hypothetical protein CRE_17437 [Caenorhabditis remanei]|uniref:DUF38 domain-containing protein n=1 Tax=Caenorhabditis remanei TaxID=31234 RepID=E3N218_CAERE|nr:hypothetical protein CRE_17437 [Caenorhabditis remanei]
MFLPLSYPRLKCVLENLEAVKRAHIMGRSSGLQKLDKLIPLHLEDFYFNRDEMTINRLIIKYDKDEVKFEMNGKTFGRQISVSREDRMKKFINLFTQDVDLKFRVNSLSTPYACFNSAISFIDPRSLPLKTLYTSIANPSTFDNQIIQFAETLNLNLFIDRIVIVEDLKKLNNKKVVFNYLDYTRVDMVSLIRYHVETKKDIRTTFVISTSDKGFINNALL